MGVAYSVGEAEHLYTFFVEWSPEIYTKSNKRSSRSRYVLKERNLKSYLIVDKNVAVINQLLSKPVRKPKSDKNWEVVTANDSKRRLSLCNSVESESEEQEDQEINNVLPVLTSHSQLLDNHHLQRLAAHMPPRTQGYPWSLVYSTAIHGSSLKTLYRNMSGLDSPVLLVIKDLHKTVFGAFSSDPFKVSKYCYGTGETFLFSFCPDLQMYRWSGDNSYFVSGNLESLQIGGGGDGFGLWLDADLYHGASFSCPTFHNPPLSTQEDFIVQDVEVWTVQN